MAKIFASLMQGTEIFLKTVREAECNKVVQHIGINHLVLQEFLDLECASSQS
jgi:hypothetical protein